MQLLCTLRNRCRQRPRNTRYQADATPYLPDLHRLDRTSLRLAHLLDHLVGGYLQAQRHGEAESLGGLEVNHQFELGWLHDR
jgi:hypothetical protein